MEPSETVNSDASKSDAATGNAATVQDAASETVVPQEAVLAETTAAPAATVAAPTIAPAPSSDAAVLSSDQTDINQPVATATDSATVATSAESAPKANAAEASQAEANVAATPAETAPVVLAPKLAQGGEFKTIEVPADLDAAPLPAEAVADVHAPDPDDVTIVEIKKELAARGGNDRRADRKDSVSRSGRFRDDGCGIEHRREEKVPCRFEASH